MNRRIVLKASAATGILLLLFNIVAFAGNIDPDDDGSKYAWGENIGWINFEPTNRPGVTVADTTVTGYGWSENTGWINMDPAYGGVTNDGNGNLSGYAWGENTGWISFSCENTGSCATVDYGVTIDPDTGVFSGYAWGENVGWISFQSNEKVKTSWRMAPLDSDDDGIPDDLENSSLCLDASDADTDDDGILDGVEDINQDGVWNEGETDPCAVDTDGDWIQDGTESGYTLADVGSDTDLSVFVQDEDPSTITDPLDDDSDGDGLLDGEEDFNYNGQVDPGESNPNTGRNLPWLLLLLLEDR